jgi:hypothetical protein
LVKYRFLLIFIDEPNIGFYPAFVGSGREVIMTAAESGMPFTSPGENVTNRTQHGSDRIHSEVRDVRLVLPPPDALEKLTDDLPEAVTATLKTLAIHRCSDLAEFKQIIPDQLFSSALSGDLIGLTEAKEIAYDEYFCVGRTMDRPRLRLTLAFLFSLRAVALNASFGHDLEPAALADLLRSIRVMANMFLRVPDRSTDLKPNEHPRPNGPW